MKVKTNAINAGTIAFEAKRSQDILSRDALHAGQKRATGPTRSGKATSKLANSSPFFFFSASQNNLRSERRDYLLIKNSKSYPQTRADGNERRSFGRKYL